MPEMGTEFLCYRNYIIKTPTVCINYRSFYDITIYYKDI